MMVDDGGKPCITLLIVGCFKHAFWYFRDSHQSNAYQDMVSRWTDCIIGTQNYYLFFDNSMNFAVQILVELSMKVSKHCWTSKQVLRIMWTVVGAKMLQIYARLPLRRPSL